MSKKTYRVKEVSRMAGVTVRTLHHYDEIGLLIPSDRTRSGYRLYDEDDLLRLQQIVIGRELGMPLERIRRMLDDPAFDRRRALLEQRDRLLARAERTETMIRSVDAALAALEGRTPVDPTNLFDGFDPSRYEEEARTRWGHTDVYAIAAERTRRYSKRDWEEMKTEADTLMQRLARRMAEGASPDEDDVMDLAEQHRLHVDRWFYPCDHATHAGLAELYVTDERFRASFDRHGAGLAVFLAESIRANSGRRGPQA